MAWSLDQILDNPTTSVIIATSVITVCTGIWAWFRRKQLMGFLSWWHWRCLHRRFEKRCRQTRGNLKIVSLDDYVFLLEMLRREILSKYTNPKITIHALTMQLPSDWPLWDTEINHEHPKTALEQYYFELNDFLSKQNTGGYQVDIRRIVIIDNKSSWNGRNRFSQLVKDVGTPLFDHYVKFLHNKEEDARYLQYSRPWPGWLSDAVFYGVTESNGPRKWLWGVTTSYNANEDLILLRVHRLSKAIELPQSLALPLGKHSLQELADFAGRDDIFKPLSELKISAERTA